MLDTLKDMFSLHDHVLRKEKLPQPTEGMPFLCSELKVGLNVIAARPGMGATTLAVSMATELALAGKWVLYISYPHQNAYNLFIRQFGYHLNIPYVRKNNADYKLWEDNFSELDKVRLFYANIDYHCDFLVFQEKLWEYVRKRGRIEYIFIDCIQDFSTEKELHNISLVDFVCKELRSMSYMFDVPIIVTSELNRNPEFRCGIDGKKPQLGDLRGGNVEQYAQLVYFPYRSEYYHIYNDEKDNSDLRNVVQVLIEKNSANNVGEVRLKYDREHVRFHSDQSYAEFIPEIMASSSVSESGRASLVDESDLPF